MSGGAKNIESIFHAALEIDSAEQRAAFVAEQCGADAELRREVDGLLRSNDEVGTFLLRPAVELNDGLLFSPSDRVRADALDAGLAAAFDGTESVVVGGAGLSKLKLIGQTLDFVPRVTLRDTVAETEPMVRPRSPEIPLKDSDSRYQLHGEIARGGMGAILKGRDTDLGRELAIKVLLETHKDKPEVVQRFIEEAQIGGQLQHPGIAPVYELGQFADRRPFFSMKLVKGETLSKLLADRAAPTVDRAKLVGIFEQICQTMAYAHSRGVIHRDLKPANVMVGAFGEVQVMDWGLAKVLQSGGVADEKKAHTQHQGTSVIQTLRSQGGNGSGSDVTVRHSDISPEGIRRSTGSSKLERAGGLPYGSQTQMGSIMGTPAYMPPEQALGEVDLLDERADVFGLGAILAEILTGKPPYVGDDGTQIYRMASRGKLSDCYERLDACGADPELIAIAKYCLSPEPTDRPRDAGLLTERITTHLASVETRLRATELDRAAEAARAEEALRTVAETNARAKAEAHARRLQLAVAIVALVAVSISGMMAMSAARRQRELTETAVEARQKADGERLRADDARKKADELREAAVASAEREQQLAVQAKDAQRREAEMRNLAEEREQMTQATLYAAQMNLAVQAADDPAGLRRVGEIVDAWKPDRAVRDLRGWEWYYLDSLRHLARTNLPNHDAIGLRWSPDGKRYVTFGRDARIRMWDFESGEQLFESVGHTSYVYEARWNPAGTLLASAGRDQVVRFWDAKDGSQVGSSMEFSNFVYAVRWSPDGTRVAIKTGFEVAVCSVESRQVIRRWPTVQGEANVSWHPKLERLAVPHAVLDVKTGETLWNHQGEYVEWSPDGTRLATSGFSEASILSAEDGHELSKITIPDGSILAMSWSPQGDAVAFGLRDSTVRVWSPKTNQPPVVLRGHADVVFDVAWNHDGTQLASTSNDFIKLWDWPARTNPAVIQQAQSFDVNWAPDGKSLLMTSSRLDVWQRETSTLLTTVPIGRGGLDSGFTSTVSMSHTAGSIAARRDGKLVVLDAKTGDLRREISGDWERTRSLALNPDGSRLATSTYRPKTADREEHCEIILYDTATGELAWQQKLHGDRAGSMAWSPDGRQLACGGWTSMEILKAEDGRSVAHNAGAYELGWVHDLSWSPDGERLVLGHMNHTLRIIDARTGRELNKLVGHTGPVKTVRWSPDGQRIASGGDDKTVRLWNPQTGLQVLVLRQHQAPVQSIAWSPDGQQLATGSTRGELLIWDARRGIVADHFAPSPTLPTSAPTAPETLASVEEQLAGLTKLLEADEQNQNALLARAALLARLGRWTDSADTFIRLTKIAPTSRFAWGMAATPLLMANETDRYREHCLAMVAQFRGTTEADVADTVCKNALLRPDVIPFKDLPIQTLRDGVADPKWEPFRPWFIACCALISYREGQPAEAIRWTNQLTEFRHQPGTLALVVRAMAEHRLGQHEAARESLKAAELQIPLSLRTLGTAGDSTPLPVPNGIVDHDWLVPELLRREAAGLK